MTDPQAPGTVRTGLGASEVHGPDTEHRELCSGDVKPRYDCDSGRHVVGWSCPDCGRQFSREDRERDGVTYRYIVTPTDGSGGQS